MRYRNIVPGEFLERPNRFIAEVLIDDRIETVHVKNTGRCEELLKKGARVYLEKSDNPHRKTAYDLIAVKKGARLINMDSQAPNKVVEEWLNSMKERREGIFPNLVSIRPEATYLSSRFDFYLEAGRKDMIFMEVKGVTLENHGVVSFPDAPSERALKHIEELIRATRKGYKAYIVFIIQMKGVRYFTPNETMHPAFADALRRAVKAGVNVLAYDCHVKADEIRIRERVAVRMEEGTSKVQPAINTPKLRIAEPLLEWYDKNKRSLPWREQSDPYRIWVSEIMLQQTRVEAVKGYYTRFMERFADIKSLAEAEEEVLLKQWEGLGYYNRVRNMQQAARQIQENYQGKMPDEYEELLKLKGIGSYTAGAISSIAFQKPVPAVDGNVLRVVSRLCMEEGQISDSKVKKRIEQLLWDNIPLHSPGDFNQAMMELGACVCIPVGAPHCGTCPLSHLCKAHKCGQETDYPRKGEKKERTIEERTILVIRDENKAALKKRPKTGLLAGMYEIPSIQGFQDAGAVTDYLKRRGLEIIHIKPLPKAKHIFSHREWHMQGYMVRVDELSPRKLSGDTKDWIFIEPEETKDRYPIPTAFSAFTNYLNIKLGNEKY